MATGKGYRRWIIYLISVLLMSVLIYYGSITFVQSNPAWRDTIDISIPSQFQQNLEDSVKTRQQSVLDRYFMYRNKTLQAMFHVSEELRHLVQSRLYYIQNPKNCEKARKLVCDMKYTAGFGSLVHHVVACQIAAYATNRTLILESNGWYGAENGWQTLFQPLSETCTSTYGQQAVKWTKQEKIDNALVVKMPHFADLLNIRNKYPFFPNSIPADLLPKIQRFHSDPLAWWLGQIVSYLIRPNKEFQGYFHRKEFMSGFRNPIVGIHVRRTDKINNEAKFHYLKEYMSHADRWFEEYAKYNPGAPRIVYLASDDIDVWRKAQQNYKDYVFVSDIEFQREINTGRYTETSLAFITQDVLFLSSCDYIVCTFSSNVCRLAYELMQAKHVDATNMVKSLDYDYFFSLRKYEVIESHEGNGKELELQVGDKVLQLLRFQQMGREGFITGKNVRTEKIGLFPSHKVKHLFEPVEMPTYPEVNISWL